VSIDEVLAGEMQTYEPDAPVSGRPADRVFQNWTLANYLQDNTIDNGIYGYGDFTKLPDFSTAETLSCDDSWNDRTVSQYGTDYIRVQCNTDFTIEVQGQDIVDLLPADPHSGDYYFWSNSGDESHMTLSHDFDFSEVSGPITLDYWAWYDLERDYDYVYLTATTDGSTWQILNTSSCTTDNPTGANYGCGLNGDSQGWVNETVDLSQFAGKKVTLQFEYITDAAVNGEGLLLDDMRIDAIGYATDLEADDGGWQAAGFVRISNSLPQAYALALMQPGRQNKVEKWLTLSGLNQTITVNYDPNQANSVLAISGLTRHTHTPAAYRIKITPLN
jgi:immune inhibitor A